MAQYKIVDGPAKHDFFIGLCFGGNDTHPKRIALAFTLATSDPNHKIYSKVQVDGGDREDGSGESWNFRGYVRSTSLNVAALGGKFEGYYDLRTRKGFMNIEQ